MSDSGLLLDSVCFGYGDGPWSLQVPRLALGGEPVTCIVGPNGSGKSTLLRIAAGILAPLKGTVTLQGYPLAELSRHTIALSLGFLPQESVPLYDYSVSTVAALGRYTHLAGFGMLTERDRDAIERALTAVDMTALRDRQLSHLSGGERRRALIASVLAQEPKLLLLDEPTSALDMHHATAVMRMLSALGEAGPAVVVVTHDINLAALFGTRLILLRDGGLRADGAPEEVISEAIMRETYGHDVLVRTHPETGGPIVLPRKGGMGFGSEH